MSAESWPRGWANGDASPKQQLYPRPLLLLLLPLLLPLSAPVPLPPPSRQSLPNRLPQQRKMAPPLRLRPTPRWGRSRPRPACHKGSTAGGTASAAATSFAGAGRACAAPSPRARALRRRETGVCGCAPPPGAGSRGRAAAGASGLVVPLGVRGQAPPLPVRRRALPLGLRLLRALKTDLAPHLSLSPPLTSSRRLLRGSASAPQEGMFRVNTFKSPLSVVFC